jgi:ATP-dependent helicase/nuclease subunit B
MSSSSWLACSDPASRGFLSRAIPRSARDFGGEYDHLARVAEWQTAVDADGGDGDD